MPLDLARVRSLLPGREVHYFERVESTMTVAARMAAAGCAPGSVVVAEEQTAGRGRHGHSWHSEPEAGLYLTIVLRPRETVPVLTLAAGLAVREAIETPCDLRWPNDVMIGERKCAGILLTLDQDAVLAGIGVNVNHAAFPAELAPLATSLSQAAGRRIVREDLLARIVQSVDRHAALPPGDVLRAFTQASSYVSGRRVRIEGTPLEGITAGLDEHGFLLLRTPGGRIERVLAGGVRPVGH